jgi:serine/threonine-protein kinase
MAPEQLEGREIGPAADVYALAAVCFEALTGEKARPGRTPVEIAHRVATTPPPDVRSHVPELSAAAADALRRGMALAPDERPRTAVRLAAELADALRRPPLPREPATAPLGRAPATTPLRPTRRASRRPLAGVLAAALIALAAAAVVAAVMLGNGGDDGGQRSEQPAQDKQSRTQQREPEPSSASQPSDTAPADQPAAPDTSASADPARGAALNEQGFALMGRGDFAGAVPLLRQAVASWPEDSTDLEYAYALFNLGKSLNQSGSPAEAIPFLEKRLNWSNQRGVVKQELELARQNAGQG